MAASCLARIMGRKVNPEAEQERVAEKEGAKAELRNALIGLMLLPLLVAFNFTYQMLIKGPEGVNLTEIVQVPFDLILLSISALVGASFGGYSKPRDWPWLALVVGIALILFSGAIHAYVQYKGEQPGGQPMPEFWNNVLSVYVPDSLGLATFVWAINAIRGQPPYREE